jgi:hypothetical protein
MVKLFPVCPLMNQICGRRFTLHMPRDDDSIDGMPPRHGNNGKARKNGNNGNGGSGAAIIAGSVSFFSLLGAPMGVAALLV